MEEFKQGFIDEALQLLEKLEERLIHLENEEIVDDDVQEIFRIMHTIKGSSAMFSFKQTENITHQLEDVYDMIRDGALAFTTELLGLTIDTVDILKYLLNNDDQLTNDLQNQYNAVQKKTQSFIPDSAQSYTETPEQTEFGVFDELKEHSNTHYYIYFKPDADILKRGVAPVSVFEELADLGNITGFVYTGDVPPPEQYDPADFFLSWDLFIQTSEEKEDVEDCFMFFLEHEYRIIDITPGKLAENLEFCNTCINLVQGKVDIPEIEQKLVSAFKVSQAKEEVKPKTPEEDSAKKETSTAEIKKGGSKDIESIKVDSGKLDELINLVSELVTINSQLTNQSLKIEDETLQKTVKTLGKLSKRFRDNALELRLIPVKVLILKLQRLIRDLSKSLGKEIDFITEGTHTELDKNIIAKLEGPLMHILRNSIDHGIESKEERIAAGKPEKGVIRFISFYSGSNVFIQIQDDGQGIDLNKVKEKGIDKGLIATDTEIAKQEIFNLLFTPGFSTAGEITNVSGRGVGLDVVKKEITEMRGEIDIESEVGLGTSFTLKLPLTLSIIDTLMVTVGKAKLLIPREFIIHTNIQDEAKSNDDKLEFENKVLPVISLPSDFGLAESGNKKTYNVIVKQYDKLYAIRVNKIVGEHQAVVKPLGYYNQNHDYFSGASILGDGSLAFILDVNKVISLKKNKNTLGHYNLK